MPSSLDQVKKIIFGGKRGKRKQKNEVQTQSSDAGIQQPAKQTNPVPSASSSQQNAIELGESHGATYASNANTDATIPPLLNDNAAMTGHSQQPARPLSQREQTKQKKHKLFPSKDLVGKHKYKLGIKVLKEPGDASRAIDIVFVHGLTGDAFNTWLEDKFGIYWPLDLLGNDLPNARIMTFGYDADVMHAKGPISQNNLEDNAETLLNDLAGERVRLVRCSHILTLFAP
jgi:hypothetical protein